MSIMVGTKVEAFVKDEIDEVARKLSESRGRSVTPSEVVRESIHAYLKLDTRNNQIIAPLSKSDVLHNEMGFLFALNSAKLLKSFIQNTLPEDESKKIIESCRDEVNQSYNEITKGLKHEE